MSENETQLPATAGAESQPAQAAGPTHMDNPNSASEMASWKPRVNPWLIAMTVALAAFMEVLDTSIALSLIHI